MSDVLRKFEQEMNVTTYGLYSKSCFFSRFRSDYLYSSFTAYRFFLRELKTKIRGFLEWKRMWISPVSLELSCGVRGSGLKDQQEKRGDYLKIR